MCTTRYGNLYYILHCINEKHAGDAYFKLATISTARTTTTKTTTTISATKGATKSMAN